MKTIDCKKLSTQIQDEIAQTTAKCKRAPHLLVVTVGTDPASEIYVRNKKRVAEKVGIEVEHITFSETVTQEILETFIEVKGYNPEIDGILVQLPLPAHLNVAGIMDKIPKEKDVDGFSWRNLGHALIDGPHHMACTPQAVMFIIKQVYPDLNGKTVTVLGRSNIVGKPLAAELINAGATVSVCNSTTPKDVRTTLCQQSDIVVSATGVPKTVGYDELQNTALVIDVGINKIGKNIVGDIDVDSLEKHAYQGSITPVPGGVGLLTVTFLMVNTLNAYLQAQEPYFLHTQKV